MSDQHLNLSNLHQIALKAAFAAGAEILKSYSKFQIYYKKDNSLLTTADLSANEAIYKILSKTQIPICSEESILPFNQRDENSIFWLVDPLDGTREFVSRSGEFCVCIALIYRSRPILGVIYSPVHNQIYSSYQGSSIYKNGEIISINENESSLISGKSKNDIDKFAKNFNLDIIKLSSAIKFPYLVQGFAGVFIRLYGSSLWDTAAGDFLLHQSGGIMLSLSDLKPLNYAKKETLNDNFIALSSLQKPNLSRYLDYLNSSKNIKFSNNID
ncbi:inositol monophosphatase family protein [Campylobacter sp. CX2-4080-23]|uniref:3'(2'),5'-bisphosphate nucleotidase CysQ family protein n=1 Tax=Campylobacter porcelli TaxID=1660073 RepID=UPI002EA179B7|nr:inositol monophosphatase family protein [Campylobacter sp. CX2-4080-23]